MLSKVPGLVQHIQGHPFDSYRAYSVLEEDKGLLGTSDDFLRSREKDAFGRRSFQRPILHQRLLEFAQKTGVSIHWGHKLESLQQDEDSVSVTFANGVQQTFSFIVGCDGIHSNTRACLFGKEPTTYTGLSQVRLNQ